jgi:hypothetical protein
VGGRIEHRVSCIGHLVRGGCEPAGLGNQFAQENPLEQLEAAGQAASDRELDDVLAKLDSRRSTFSLSHFGQLVPAALAPTRWRREKRLPHSLHRYS